MGPGTGTGSPGGTPESETRTGPGEGTESSPGAEAGAGESEEESGGASSGSGVETTGEQRARLEGELDESLREFDGLILREQEVLDERREAEAGAGGASGGATGEAPVQTADGGASTAGGTGGSPDSPEGEPRSGEPGAPVGADKEGIETTKNGRIPGDVGDGKDDDIVAGQLREAAINEEDPELREKLWEEYRAYKFGETKKSRTPAPPEEKKEETRP